MQPASCWDYSQKKRSQTLRETSPTLSHCPPLFYWYGSCGFLLIALREPDLQHPVLVGRLRGSRIDHVRQLQLLQIPSLRRVHTNLQRPVGRFQLDLVLLDPRQLCNNHNLPPVIHDIHQRLALLLDQRTPSTLLHVPELADDRLPVRTDRHGEAVDEG